MQKAEKDLLVNKNYDFVISTYYHYGRTDMKEDHYHRHYEILFVCENDRWLIVKDRKVSVNKNSILLMPPFVLHRTICGTKSPQKVFLINFTDNFAKKIKELLDLDVKKIFDSQTFTIPIPDDSLGFISQLIESIYTEQENGGTLGKTNSFLSLCRLLSELASLRPASSDDYHYDKTLSDIIHYFEYHFDENINADFLSKKFHVSKYDLSRLFKKHTGVTMVRYLNNIRISKAKEYLKDNQYNVTKIAMLTGFGSATSFARVFKQFTDMSPQNYKKWISSLKEDKKI